LFDPNVLTIGFARRFSGYKRGDLTPRREVPRYNCTQFSGALKGSLIGGTEISKSS
jgi:glucan phosphorylase